MQLPQTTRAFIVMVLEISIYLRLRNLPSLTLFPGAYNCTEWLHKIQQL